MKKEYIFGVIGLGVAFMMYRVYQGDDTGEAIIERLVATIFACVFVGFLVITYLLPLFSDKVSDFVFSDSGEAPEQDSMSYARALVAQGEYEDAIGEYHRVIEEEPTNRLAWVSVAKIYTDHLDSPEMFIPTYRSAYESAEWEDDDAAFFLFRIADWQFDQQGDKEARIATLYEVIEAFPDSRHSANAKSGLRKIGVQIEDV